MSSAEKELYKNIKVETPEAPKPAIASRAYRGISTINKGNKAFVLYDVGLIKQDLLNHFHIRQGEKLENPEFGCIIWDALFEPLTDTLKEAIAKNVTDIVNYDPRTRASDIIVDSFEHGIQIECNLTYLPYNISEQLRFKFDERNGLVN
jgi:phage baseplate assembly protein W